MSLRFKFIVALLATSLLSISIVGFVAYERLLRRFDDITLERSARNFTGDVAAYVLTYGSWEEGIKRETFRHFVERRKALIAGVTPASFAAVRIDMRTLDTGGPLDAAPIEPAVATGRGPVGGSRDGGRPARGSPGSVMQSPPPFIFLLYDSSGRVLNPPPQAGRQVTDAERKRAVPIHVNGRIVAFASPIGAPNYSLTERSYVDGLRDAMMLGAGAAVPLAVGFGLFVGHRMSRSLRQLTGAIESMQDGALQQQVPISSRDEVGLLAGAFNSMSAALAESHRQLEASHQLVSQQAEQLRQVAGHDVLTGLANRRHFDDHAPALFEQARHSGQDVSVAIADIDFFKRINDDFSHALGDAVLREVGKILREQTRAGDIAARYGGEEFVFVFSGTSAEDAARVCERMRFTIEAHPWDKLHQDLQVTLSIGVVSGGPTVGLHEMVALADRRLYRAKADGRNRICVHDAESMVA